MADPNTLGQRVHSNALAARAVIRDHGSPERNALLTNAYGPTPPQPNQDAFLYAAYQSELLAGLAEIVASLEVRVP